MAAPELWQSAPSTQPSRAAWGNPLAGRSGSAPRQARIDSSRKSWRCEETADAERASRRGLALKRAMDLGFSLLILTGLAPCLLLIALAIKFDSPGPVLYISERIGKGGRVFGCFKFRTMVRDADTRRAAITHLNERDKVLFKVTNDPRVTRVGRMLRKYSLDELPQFFNVLSGAMSIVGPRPPVASEVLEYNLNQLRRLYVTPGITGLWQVQSRHDPSFDSYVSLDLTYIENWSVALDLKIMARTLGIVLSGTGV
jgi:lipopolysaccharide/colanic/teichoic acid biosynthesis glycosyltransferase